MDTQAIINTVIAALGFLMGAILKAVWDGLKDLQRADIEIVDKVHDLETIVAGTYVKRDEMIKITDGLFHKFDTVNDKLDDIKDGLSGKMNRADCDGCAPLTRRLTDRNDHG